MSHSNATDGIKQANRTFRQTEALLDVKRFKQQYIHGIETKDNQGQEVEDHVLQQYLDIAASILEHDLDIAIMPRHEVEEKDYHGNDYWEWGYFQLNNYPVIQVYSMKVTFLRDQNGASEQILEIPGNWIRLREHDGTIRLVPNNKFPASLQVDASGTFFPEIFRRHSLVPQLWTIEYQAGFREGKVPLSINAAIGLLAAILVYNNAADLLLGAGISSTSLSLDGLQQSLTSTASAENTTYSARIREANRLLFGDGINSPNRGLIRMLRDYYSGERLNII